MQRKAGRKFSNKETILWSSIIQLHISEMISIRKDFNGSVIYSDSLIKGDYSYLEKAFLYCNLILDHLKVKKVIRSDIWGVTV